MGKKHKLNEDDLLIRKAVVICQGNLHKVSELTGVAYQSVSLRLNRVKNKSWWQAQKKKFKKVRRNARWLRSYHVQRNAAIDRERILLMHERSQNHDILD